MKPMIKSKWSVVVATILMTVASGTTLLFAHSNTSAHDGGSDMHQGDHSSATAPENEVEVVIQKGGQPRLKGPQTQGQVIALVAGQPAVLAFRNEDTVPREFVSPLFTRAEIHFAGQATGIVRKDAAGFRLTPGSTLTLQFITPHSGFPKMYDLIWCSHDHGQEPDTEFEELLVVLTREQ